MRRIIFSITIFLFSLSSVMGQMIPINLPADGNWPTIVGDSIMIIGPRQNELTEEQRYFNPVYLMTYPGKEYLKAQMIRAGACDCDPTKPNRRIGVFSVAPDKQVSFSQGNLQYLPAINLWKFADTQYEYLGNANKYLKPTFRNWVDLFGWSASNTTAPFGVSTSTNAADYAGDFVDWGTNTICGDAPSTWRTLSNAEWEYVLNGRDNASQLRFRAQVNNVNGFVLLPDEWTCPEGIALNMEQANTQVFTLNDWAVMENAGAAFLPAAGRMKDKSVLSCDDHGNYWSSTRINNTYVDYFAFSFSSNKIYVDHIEPILVARSVRLVHDTIVPRTIPKRIGVFSVAADKQVSFSQGNLQYTQSKNQWCFAENQYDYLGEENVKDGVLADKIDLFGWSGEGSNAPFGVSTSTNNADYAGEFVDWGSNIIQGDAANTWRTLSKEEWEYLIKGRKNASNLRAAAQVNGVNGMILLPDDWECPEGIDFKAGYHTSKGSEYYAEYQQFTKEQWREIETTGAIFLPAAGMHDGNGIADIQAGGYYWSATDNGDTYAYTLISQSSGAYLTYDNRYDVRAVRLVHDTIVPEAVDLGLSVKWATFNVGASKPEDYGDYFAWGETETKDKYSWATYKWCDGTSTNMTKYNTEDGKTILEPADDAAQVHWGGKWRMPSKEEVDELTQQCSWIWTTHNNVNGYKVTGPNGNSIFLPAAGYKGSGPTYPAGEDGLYWTNTIEKQHYSYLIVLHDDAPPTQAGSSGTRCFGFAVRAVYDDRPKSKIIWYTDEAIKDGSNRPSITGMAGWAYLHPEGRESTELNRRYQGKRINCIRLQVAQAGTFTISVANRDRLDSIFNIQTIMLKDPSKESQVYHLPQTIHLQKNQVLVFANLTDQARFYYSSNVGDISFADYVGHPDQTVRIAEGPKTLNIDAGYYCEDGDNCDTLAIPEPEYVDLGLSVKWATFNVGATSPEDYGDYFAWGETEPKETYSWATYKWGTSSNLTKYNTTDGKTILDHEDDAAQVHWGGKWRMPTKAECQELIDSCTWEWTTSNNINGYRVTGPNGHSIFLPAGGVRIGNASYAIGEFGYYWSASLMIDSISEAHSIVFTPTSKSCDSDSLYRGRKIRPVYDDRVE